MMKSLQDIYDGIRKKFYDKTSIDVQKGTAIDYFILSSSEMIKEAHQEIEDNKTPHLYTSLSGKNIDELGILCGITRRTDESDKNYLYRVMNWNASNKSSNMTAIESALMDMTYCSNASYIPHAFGCGTAAVYVIPKKMDETGEDNAIAEVKVRLKDVVSPSTYVEYIIPTVVPIKLTCLIKTNSADLDTIKNNISSKVVKYINGIAPGTHLEIGEINKIGISEPNVTYFNVAHFIINGQETGDISALQKIESKFLISESDIEWTEVR